MALNNFQRDLEWGKQGEEIVKQALSALTDDFTFEDVSNDRCFFYCGDIKAIDKRSGKEYFIEVKNDSRIVDTGNILCEEEVYYKRHDYYGKANMDGESDVFAIVSKAENKIYFIDFKILKANYRLGEFKKLDYPQQFSYVYLLPICTIKKLGGLIAVIDYKDLRIAASPFSFDRREENGT